MNPEPSSEQPLSAYAALKYPQFVAFIFGNSLFTMAILIQEVVLGYSIYRMTHDPLDLGFIGLAEALPYISIALFGGHLADRRNKKTLIQISLLCIIAGSLILIWATSAFVGLSQPTVLIIIYSVIMLIGFSKGFLNPAAGSLIAFLVPKSVFTNATTWQSSFWQAGAILGPGTAGFIYAYFGLTATLWFVVALFVTVMILMSFITAPAIPIQKTPMGIFTSLREGIAYVFKTKIILYATLLDLFSVLFGGVVALLPVYSEDILHVGAKGLGILRAAPSIGAVLMMMILIRHPPMKQAWRNLLLAIGGFGLATLVFAVSTNIWLSAAALFLTGAFDSISVIIRQAVIYFFTPDDMRGRVSSVNGIFISSSNELGAFESGFAAKLFGTVPSVIFGGAFTLIFVTIVWFRSPSFFKLKFDK